MNHGMQMMNLTYKTSDRSRPSGFTLVEILIVVVVLGILAAIAIPKFTNASHSANESSLKDDLRYLRTQITVYQSQHRDVAPGYAGGDISAGATNQTFADQLTKCTDEAGNVSATPSAAYPFGPYLSAIPINPVNNLSTVEIVAAGGTLTPDDTTGWLFQPSTGMIIPNNSGADSQGNLYASY